MSDRLKEIELRWTVEGGDPVRKLQTENDRLREALEYIANWRSDQTSPQAEYARAALKEEAGR